MSIYELINEIDRQDIVLPAIQRDFVWDEERIELLLDSIFRGYPVGIVLLWETYTPIQFRTFPRNHVPGGIYQFEENKKGRRMQLVLDGQQRLSPTCAVGGWGSVFLIARVEEDQGVDG